MPNNLPRPPRPTIQLKLLRPYPIVLADNWVRSFYVQGIAMASLTPKRFTKVEPQLKEMLATMKEHGASSVDPESVLGKALGLDYKELNGVFDDLIAKSKLYAPIGAVGLENSSGHSGGPRFEAKGPLAKAYGVDCYDNQREEMESLRVEWFASFGIDYNS